MSLPGRFLTIGGQRVFYHRSGRGRPLLLVHGYAMSHYGWRRVIPALAAEHDVIALDLPGFGESDRPDPTTYRYDAAGFMDTLIGVLDALRLERATFIGHSMGGAASLYTAARRPERVDRLVVVDPLVYPFEMPAEGRIIGLPVVGGWAFRHLSSRGITRRFMRKRIYRDLALITDDWVDYVWERMNRPGGMAAAAAALRFIYNPSMVSQSVRAVRAPTLITWGEDDLLFPSAFARRLSLDIAGSQVAIIPDCGHSPPEERPDQWIAAVLPFLSGRVERRVA
jgi:pimeloyl-ACP methyl ester carboxylesterase